MLRSVSALWLLLATTAQAACPGYSKCPAVDYPFVLAHSPEVRSARMAIDAQEAETLRLLQTNMRFGKLIARLGQALVFDKSLSVNRNEACAFCHNPATGFKGGIPAFAKVGGIMPGSVQWRAGPRAPQSLAYAAFAPVLTLKPDGTFVGGNFWDGRATGEVTGSAAADQALDALTGPTEMALPDPACAVRRVALAPYGKLFEKIWGREFFAVSWPAGTEELCGRPNNGGVDQAPLQLNASDRARATTAFHQIGLTIAAYEVSALASPFSSKFDAVQAGNAVFTTQERRGYELFIGKAHCSSCHSAEGKHPLFTDFSFHNVGVPANDHLPFLGESKADQAGYRANPVDRGFFDEGLGGFLFSNGDFHQDWRNQARFDVKSFQTPTLRNIATQADLQGCTYMHNGSLDSLRKAVMFSASQIPSIFEKSTFTNTEIAALLDFLRTLNDSN